MAEEEAKHIKRKEITRNLSCKLTTDEIVSMASESADLEQRIRLLDEELKEKAQEFKGKIKSAEGQIMRLSACIRSRSEERPVHCEQVFDYDEGEVRIVRLDTDEVIDSRSMTVEEKQIELNLEQEEQPEEETVDPDLPEDAPEGSLEEDIKTKQAEDEASRELYSEDNDDEE